MLLAVIEVEVQVVEGEAVADKQEEDVTDPADSGTCVVVLQVEIKQPAPATLPRILGGLNCPTTDESCENDECK